MVLSLDQEREELNRERRIWRREKLEYQEHLEYIEQLLNLKEENIQELNQQVVEKDLEIKKLKDQMDQLADDWLEERMGNVREEDLVSEASVYGPKKDKMEKMDQGETSEPHGPEARVIKRPRVDDQPIVNPPTDLGSESKNKNSEKDSDEDKVDP